jgi:antitoxin YqcF
MDRTLYNPDDQKILEAFTAVAGEVASTRRLTGRDSRRTDIVTVENSPRAGVNSYSTIGLSVIPIGFLSGAVYLGAELTAVAGAKFDRYIDVLAVCVTAILESKQRLFPGAVCKDAFKDVYPDAAVKHLIFDTPQGWESDLLTLDLGVRQAAWLMAIPVTDAELNLYSDNETGELQERFDNLHTDLADFDRPSVA